MLKRLLIISALLLTASAGAQITMQDSLRVDSTGISADTLSRRDTTGLFSDSTFQKADSLIPIHTSPLFNSSEMISHQAIRFSNWRYTDELLRLSPLIISEDYGSVGYPGRRFIYGLQTGNYLVDGSPVSTFNYPGDFDLNLIQAENIDSVEILTLPRSILFGGSPVVNFIYKDVVPLKPYTRIKYYQGADGEAMFDGQFATLLYKRLYGYLDVTNRKLDRSYANTAFSSWQVTSKLKYLVSNETNINLSYNFSKQYKGLNGGVSVDSITSGSVIDKNTMFNQQLAPVNFYNTDTDEKLHNFDLNVLTKPFSGYSADVSVYYHFLEQSINNIGDITSYDTLIKGKLYGANIRQNYSLDYLRLNLNIDYNYTDDNYNYSITNTISKLFRLSGAVELNLTDLVKPSIFYSFNKYIGNQSNAIGFDILFDKFDYLKLYAGYALNDFSGKSEPMFQAFALYTNKNFYMKGDYFTAKKEFFLFSFKVNGISGTIGYRLGSFDLEVAGSHYVNNNIDHLPSDVFTGGVYFNDSLFYPNLLLKSGFKFNYTGKRNYGSMTTLEPDYTIDFTLSGEIRKVAVVYFTWENLLDRKYYIVPFYPMYARNLRFGVSWELFN